ncbi:inositol monophosphatase family protein [Candidatus Chlamydia sanziniae]|uniref:inositol monophosphatase family protein n=1 Tax=Candidatus Chlamydia sanziniae TaxID=1806891 RepID=UPI0008374286
MRAHLPNYQNVAESIVLKIINELINYRNQHSLVPTWTKPDGSFVTPPDYGIQYYLQKQLCAAFPNIPFIGEEIILDEDWEKVPEILKFVHRLDPSASTNDIIRTLEFRPDSTSLFWLADPIDGTAGFIKNRYFAIALSLIYQYQPVLTVMACPSYHQTFKIYSAGKDLGMFISDATQRRHRVVYTEKVRTGKFCEASLAARNQQHHATRLFSLGLPDQPRPHRVESQYKYALVAEGAVDFFIRYPFTHGQARIWDHIPGAFLVEESGGQVTDVFGASLNYNKEKLSLENHPIILASGSKKIHEVTLEALQCYLTSSKNLAAHET